MRSDDLLGRTFVQLADSLVDSFDIIDLLTMLADRSVELLDVQAAGILLADADGNLRVMAASSEQVRLLELFQLQNDEGPCLEAFSTGHPVIETNLREALERWPRFTPYAVGAGFESVYALPLRLRSTVIGALNLFRTRSIPMAESELALAQALGDVASIAILQNQAAREGRLLAGQLQNALDSRVSIEQAKGMIAEGTHVDVNEAFQLLRRHARSANRLLTDVAKDLVSGEVHVEDMVPPSA
jgi:GAF domain-containing protein